MNYKLMLGYFILIFVSCVSTPEKSGQITENNSREISSFDETSSQTANETIMNSIFQFEIKDNTVIITGLIGKHQDIVIPNEIGGLPVVEIGESAFSNESLISVIIPESIMIIRESAFNRNNLSSLFLPDSVKIIGENAFSYNKIKEIKFPHGLEILNDSIFLYNSLTDITIPEGIKIIGADAFRENNLESIILPDSLSVIGNSAFYSQRTFASSITIGHNVKISEHAFTGYFGKNYTDNGSKGGTYLLRSKSGPESGKYDKQ